MGFVRVVTRVLVVAVLTICISLGSIVPTKATEVTPTILPPIAPLLITAYRMVDGTGKDLDYLEIYNNGSEPINLSTWTIMDVVNERTLKLSSPYVGWIEPDTHVVAARPDANVANASFVIDGWNGNGHNLSIATMRFIHDGYRPSEVKLAASSVAMYRSYGSSSYSTAVNPFVAENYRIPPGYPADTTLFDDGLYLIPDTPTLQIVEVYPYSSDCDPFDPSVLCGDYIKLYNPTTTAIELDGLVVRTDSSSSSRTTSNTFSLAGTLAPGEYKLVWQTDTGGRIALTNSGGYIWLEDMWGMKQYRNTMVRYDGAGTTEQGLSYAFGDDNVWHWTATPMPTGANLLTDPATTLAECPEGKYRSPETNRCRNIEEVINSLAACDEGSERNPLTNRCRKTASSDAVLTPCKEGQVRSLETNRCKSIVSEVADLIPCNDGYERNPATNRCRKVQSAAAVKGAQFPVEPATVATGNTAGFWTLAGVVAAGAGYGIWEWRIEIASAVRSVLARVFWWRK